MTISIESLLKVTSIIVHENCPDGTASAILLHDALPMASIKFVQYGTKERAELEVEKNMLFCDMTPPPERNQEFVAAGAIVLDHHKGCQEQVKAYGENGVFADEKGEPGVAGAVLAYRHVWYPVRSIEGGLMVAEASRALEFAGLAGIRDTWQKKSSLWERACEQAHALKFYPTGDLLGLERPFSLNWDVFSYKLELGELLVKRMHESMKRALKGAGRATTDRGTRLVMFNDVQVVSDAAEAEQEADLVIGFRYESDKIICSIRSHTGYDCSDLARRWGGNGHTAAAGFNDALVDEANGDPVLHPFHHIRALVDVYEHGE